MIPLLVRAGKPGNGPPTPEREPFGPLRRGVSRNFSANQELGRLRPEPGRHQAALERSMIRLSGRIMYDHKATFNL